MPAATTHALMCRVTRGAAVLTLRGPLSAQAVRAAWAAMRRGRWPKVVLDLRAARWSGPQAGREPLRALLDLRHRVAAAGGRLVLCGLSDEVTEMFRATWLLGLFEVRPDLAAARASLTP